jgi:Phage integrase, N-terminal SAM-like domain
LGLTTGTARTKREAQALRARLLTQVDEGRRPTTDATVAQLLERWLEMPDLAWNTRVTYKGYIERTILPTLGHLPLRRLDTATLDRFYSELRGRGGVGGRPMAPATVRQVHAILRRALDQAAAGAGFPPTRRPWPAHRDSARRRSARPPGRRSRGFWRRLTRLIRTSRSCSGWPRRQAPGAGKSVRCGGRTSIWRRLSS